MKRLLIITTVPNTIKSFLIPFSTHFHKLGWQVDCAAAQVSKSQECLNNFDKCYDIEWSRNPLDPCNLTRACRRVREVVIAGTYDVVHVHTPVAAFVTRYALRDLRKQKNFKVIYTAHGFHFHSEGDRIKNGVFLALEKLAGRWTDRLVVINREDESAALKHNIVSSDKLRYMAGIGIDTATYDRSVVATEDVDRLRKELRITEDQPILLMVAEFIPRKRHIDVLQAFADTQRQHENAVLLFAGEGPLMEQMKSLACELGILDSVRFLGHRSDIPVLMASACATLLPSTQEGLPRSVMESLSMGTPVIGSRIRGTSELLDDGCGILFVPGDIKGLADAMRQVLSHPEQTEQMGEHGRRKMTGEYELQNIIRAHEGLYDNVVSGKLPVAA